MINDISEQFAHDEGQTEAQRSRNESTVEFSSFFPVQIVQNKDAYRPNTFLQIQIRASLHNKLQRQVTTQSYGTNDMP